VAHSRRFLSTGFVLIGLALGGPACVGYVADDGATGDGDTTDNGDGDGDGDAGDGDGDPTNTTIYDLQQGMVGDGAIVSIAGVVITTPINAEDGFTFVEETAAGQWSGISLYLWDEVVIATQLAPGDVVNLVGEYTEFFDNSQIVIKYPGDIEVIGTDAIPGPDTVTAADVAATNVDAEPWEGVRVCIDNAVVEAPSDEHGQIVLVGGALIGYAFVDPLPQVHAEGTFAQVCGSLYYSFGEYKVMPAGPEDLVGYTSPAGMLATIPAIQMGGVYEPGTLVTIEDVVVSSGLTWSDTASASFFVQEAAGGPMSGIQIFVFDTSGLDIAPGDQVTITGTYEEFFGMSQIEVSGVSSITISGSGPAPTPELIDPAMIATGGAMAESYEGVLMRVENVMVTDMNPDAPMEYGEFEVSGGLRIDDEFFAMEDWTKPMVGQGYASITGPLVESFDNFKLEPRDAGDLVQN
jgi:predicted extracellular nuclease